MKRKIYIALAVFIPVFLFGVLWQTARWRPVPIGKSFGAGLEISPDGRYVVAWTDDAIQVFDVEAHAMILDHQFPGGASSDTIVDNMVFSKSGEELFVATYYSAASEEGYGKIERFSMDGTTKRADLQKVANDDDFRCSSLLRVSDDGTRLQFNGRFWDLRTGKIVSQKPLKFADDFPGKAVFSKDGSKIRYYLEDNHFVETDFTSRRVRKIPIQNVKQLKVVDFSRYGKYALVKSDNNLGGIVDFQTGRQIWEFPPRTPIWKNYFIDNDESRIAISLGREWQIRDLQTGELLNSVKCRDVSKVGAWTLNGSFIFWQSQDSTIWKQRVQ